MKTLATNFALCLTAALLASCGGGGGSGGGTGGGTPPTNSAPVLNAANANQSTLVGDSFSYDAKQGPTTSTSTFTDADGDPLTYQVSYAPSNLGLSDTNGVISGAPSAAGTVTVTITASDGNGGQASDSFNIVVSQPSTPSDKPNIVFVISDDQGRDASPQYSLSADLPVTPNLDALADSGLIFDNVWVSPSCAPTRSALITGKHGIRTGVLEPGDSLDSGETILQSFLKSNTETSVYSSAMIGKWHLGGGNSGPNDAGVDHFAGIINGGVRDYFNWDLTVNGAASTSTVYATTELTNRAIDWVDDQTDPWFLWLSYNAPHVPFHEPPDELYTTPLEMEPTDRSLYLAAIEALDTEFGRFWDNLTMDEQANTIVIYLGDNGTPRQVVDNTAQNGHKGDLLQGGVNVPMFISGPAVTRAGQREGALITHTDFFATIAELAGADLPAYQNGQSFAGLLTPPTSATRKDAYTENDEGWTVRDDTFKLINNYTSANQLYDLSSDPREQRNLLNTDVDYSLTVDELTAVANAISNTNNITGTTFSNPSPQCAEFMGLYAASATDIREETTFLASINIDDRSTHCTIDSNSIPNHNFNDGPRDFADVTREVSQSFDVPINPVFASSPTPLTTEWNTGITLNGVKMDIIAAACLDLPSERTGCNDPDTPWRFDPSFAENNFALDNNHAHTQPNGSYHYHAGPPAVISGNSAQISGVIGFASDGFPIYGPWFNDGTEIRQAISSFQLRSGLRQTGTTREVYNDVPFNGAFRDDYEYQIGTGDLDECNGMTVNGQYGYYVTDSFPYILNCFKGTPDNSFAK